MIECLVLCDYFQVVPRTSYYKMIDVWFVFLLVLVVLTIIFHTAITFILGPDNPHYSLSISRNYPDKVFAHRGSSTATDLEIGTPDSASASGRRRLEEQRREEAMNEYRENVELAKKANLVGMVIFIIILVVFNIAFWVVALSQQSTPVRNFLTTVKDKF